GRKTRQQHLSAHLLVLLMSSQLAVSDISTKQVTLEKEKTGYQHHAAKALVIDDRLSPLRRAPDLKSVVVRRLHLARAVWILAERPARNGEPRFYRVAVSRRTLGWIHADALCIPGRKNEAEKLLQSINGVTDGFDRLLLCKLFIEYFPRSSFVPQVLFELGT